jgi:transcription elongation factor GreA
MTLSDAAARYIATLKAGEAQQASPVVSRFVQWFGADRRTTDLKGPDVERFVEESAGRGGSQGRRVEALRPFLAHLKSAGLTSTNLGTAIKLRKSEASMSAAEDANQVQMTREGYEALQKEHEDLIGMRPQIAEALRLAMADKDFRENAPLDAARDQQAHVEAQIRRVEELIKRAVIVEGPAGGSGAARVGCFVSVTNLQTEQQTRYKLVSPSEVNLKEGKISVASPVGKALVDRVKGDEVSVSVPAGVIKLRVDSVES